MTFQLFEIIDINYFESFRRKRSNSDFLGNFHLEHIFGLPRKNRKTHCTHELEILKNQKLYFHLDPLGKTHQIKVVSGKWFVGIERSLTLDRQYYLQKTQKLLKKD